MAGKVRCASFCSWFDRVMDSPHIRFYLETWELVNPALLYDL